MKQTTNDTGWRIAVALISVVVTLLFKSITEKPPVESNDILLTYIVRIEERILDKAEIIVEGIYKLLRER